MEDADDSVTDVGDEDADNPALDGWMTIDSDGSVASGLVFTSLLTTTPFSVVVEHPEPIG
jgi:hypothetical protein